MELILINTRINTKGISLAETMITLVVAVMAMGLIISTVVSQRKLSSIVKTEMELVSESNIVMNHMVKHLRFADSIELRPPGHSLNPDPLSYAIVMHIQGGYLNSIPATSYYQYKRLNERTLMLVSAGNLPLSDHVIIEVAAYDGSAKNLTIALRANKNGQIVRTRSSAHLFRMP